MAAVVVLSLSFSLILCYFQVSGIQGMQDGNRCDNVKVRSKREGFITSHKNFNGTSKYGNNLNCQWIIAANDSQIIRLTFVDFSVKGTGTNCSGDKLVVYDISSSKSPKLSTLCGKTLPAVSFSEGKSLTLNFISDSSGASSGFRVEYLVLDKSMIAWCGGGPTTLTNHAGYILSHRRFNGITTYMSGQRCDWVIKGRKNMIIRLRFLHFSMESCKYDNLMVFDETPNTNKLLITLCGTNKVPEDIYSGGNRLRLRFKTDGSGVYSGYAIRYELIKKTNGNPCGDVQLLPKLRGSITSHKNYNGISKYENNLNCHWIIAGYQSQIIRLTFVNFSVEGTGKNCSGDKLVVHDGPSNNSPNMSILCGDKVPAISFSTGQSLTLNFRSNASGVSSGFRIEYEVLSKSMIAWCGGGPTTLRNHAGYILSHRRFNGITTYTNKQKCDLVIEGRKNMIIRLRFLHFSLEYNSRCRYDNLTVLDVPSDTSKMQTMLCGRKQVPSDIYSGGRRLTLKFMTDGSGIYPGFAIKYDLINEAKNVLPMVLNIGSPLMEEKENRSITCRSRDSDLSETILEFDLKDSIFYVSWTRESNYVDIYKIGDRLWRRVNMKSFPFSKLGITIHSPISDHTLSVSLFVTPLFNERQVTCRGKSKEHKGKEDSKTKQIYVVWHPSVRSLSVTDIGGRNRIVANEVASITCELQTGNPSQSALIEATFGGYSLGKPMENSFILTDNDGYEWRKVTWNKTFTRSDNMKKLTCGFRNGHQKSKEIDVQYAPSSIKWNLAVGRQLLVNDTISCNSDANPLPTIAIKLNDTEFRALGKSMLSMRIPMKMKAGRYIVECTASNKIFPSQWKRANITIHKGENPQTKRKPIKNDEPRKMDSMEAIIQIQRDRKAEKAENRKFMIKMQKDMVALLKGIRSGFKSIKSILHDKKGVNV